MRFGPDTTVFSAPLLEKRRAAEQRLILWILRGLPLIVFEPNFTCAREVIFKLVTSFHADVSQTGKIYIIKQASSRWAVQ